MEKDYYVFNNGTLKRKDNTIYFEKADGGKVPLPIENINTLHLFGEVTLNTKLLNYLSNTNVLLNIYNYYGYYSGTYLPRKSKISGYLTVKQSSVFLETDERLYLAKQFIQSAAFHILRNMRKEKEQIDELIIQIEKEKINIDNSKSIYELMGTEGRIRKIYYSAWPTLSKGQFPMSKRTKRPPEDPINSLISFGNSLMYTNVIAEIYKTQLDPTISYLHEPSTKRFSLSLDLAEIFKPLIIDPIIFSLINKGVINDDDFDSTEGLCYLNEEGRKKFVLEFEKKLSTTLKHRKLNRKVSYRYLIRLECYKLIKHMIDDEKYIPLKAWW